MGNLLVAYVVLTTVMDLVDNSREVLLLIALICCLRLNHPWDNNLRSSFCVDERISQYVRHGSEIMK